MKKILLSFFALAMFSLSASAQFSMTKWTGEVMLLQSDNSLNAADAEWDFGKDTLSVSFAGAEPEVFTYVAGKGLLTITKVSGSSPCETGAKAAIAYTLKGDQLFLVNKKTDCEAFAKALSPKPFTKMK